jgi:hypothetical protein
MIVEDIQAIVVPARVWFGSCSELTPRVVRDVLIDSPFALMVLMVEVII